MQPAEVPMTRVLWSRLAYRHAHAGIGAGCVSSLENGLKVVEPMTLMTLGLYNEPTGAYLPSVLY